MKRTKLARKTRMRQEPSPEGQAFWEAQRARVLFDLGRRRKCSGPGGCGELAYEVAHVHPLRMGQSRYKPDATCPPCGTRLNDLANLRAVCSESCNDAVEIPCRGKQ